MWHIAVANLLIGSYLEGLWAYGAIGSMSKNGWAYLAKMARGHIAPTFDAIDPARPNYTKDSYAFRNPGSCRICAINRLCLNFGLQQTLVWPDVDGWTFQACLEASNTPLLNEAEGSVSRAKCY